MDEYYYMITTKHDFEVIWRIKLSDGFSYCLKTDIVEDKYLKIVGGARCTHYCSGAEWVQIVYEFKNE